jgi:tRNA(fMet)-specific endonuclease VapC
MYLLDTNVWIAYFRSKGRGKLSQRLLSTATSQIITCSIVRAELMTGAMKSAKPALGIAEVLSVLAPLQSFDFDNQAADIYAEIRVDLESCGLTIGANDYMIAAIALVNNLTLVTHNTSEFSRIVRMKLQDWQ